MELIKRTNLMIYSIRKYKPWMKYERIIDCEIDHRKPDYETNICAHCYEPLQKDPHRFPLKGTMEGIIDEIFESELKKLNRKKSSIFFKKINL